MTTLTTPPLAQMLEQMFLEAEASTVTFMKELDDLPADQRAALFSEEADYREIYTRAKDAHLAVSPETGRLLYMLARAIGAASIIEFGTSLGVSTLHLAAALRDNGGGRLIGSEFQPSKVVRARQSVARAGLADLVEIREGDALETLGRDLPEKIDMVLLDGAKGLYPTILSLVEDRLGPGALLVADNADRSPKYLARVRSAEAGYLSVPFSGDVELSIRIG
jgi:predicted O-methyltransferase YrrM